MPSTHILQEQAEHASAAAEAALSASKALSEAASIAHEQLILAKQQAQAASSAANSALNAAKLASAAASGAAQQVENAKQVAGVSILVWSHKFMQKPEETSNTMIFLVPLPTELHIVSIISLLVLI